MTVFPNLLSGSVLVSDTVSLLRSFGGKASAVSVVDFVMKIRRPEPSLARWLAADLIARDPRLALNGDMVELVADANENRELATTGFVVFDLETTGARPGRCRVTEIGAYRVVNGQVTDEFQTLVNPEQQIPPFITGLTGISDEMVADAPLFRNIAPDFLNFIGDSVLVAHNSGFDMRFLNYEIARAFGDYSVANPCLCTVRLARRLVPETVNHKLKTLAEHYRLDLTNHHRAAADAHATAHIFVNLLTRLYESGVNDLDSARRIGSRKYRYA